MLDWIKKLFADANGVPDDARIAAFLLVLSFIGNSITGVVMSTSHAFDAQAFGIGAGAQSSCVTASMAIRRRISALFAIWRQTDLTSLFLTSARMVKAKAS